MGNGLTLLLLCTDENRRDLKEELFGEITIQKGHNDHRQDVFSDSQNIILLPSFHSMRIQESSRIDISIAGSLNQVLGATTIFELLELSHAPQNKQIKHSLMPSFVIWSSKGNPVIFDNRCLHNGILKPQLWCYYYLRMTWVKPSTPPRKSTIRNYVMGTR